MQGNKTHEQQKRILERKDDGPSGRGTGTAKVARREGRQSEFPISSGGMNQESDHNKHNHSTQQNHKPQTPEPAQEKQD